MESSTALPARQRRCLLCAVLVALAAIVPATSAAERRGTDGTLLRAINAARAQNGLSAVHLNDKLDAAAEAHSDAMAASGVFEHTVPGEAEFGDRLAAQDWHGSSAAENIALVSRLAITVRLWLASPPHRAALLSGEYDFVGIGITRGPSGWYVTADFGR